MRKCFLIFVLFLLLTVPTQAKIITGGVEVSVNQAREEIFSNSTPNPDFKSIHANLSDKNYLENYTELLKGNTALKDRTLAKFSDGSYGVIYLENPVEVFYYSPDGILTHNEIKSSLNYPYKTFKYNIYGELVNVSLRVSENETFIFSPRGKLYAHWVGSNCYNEENKIIMTRKIFN